MFVFIKNITVQQWFGIASFLFFALSLGISSGYSYGAFLFILISVWNFNKWFVYRKENLTILSATTFVVSGLMWSHTFNGFWEWTGSDQWLKYGLAALCLMAVARLGIHLSGVHWGMAAGGLGALAIAGYQYLVLGMSKAEGYTNAIQYGGLAMYLGIAAWCLALLAKPNKWVQLALYIGGASAVLASLLSETRGAWVVAPMLVFVLLAWMCQFGRAKQVGIFVLAVSALLAAMVLPYAEKFTSRADLAVVELQHYSQNPAQAAETSIGQRLEQWRLAWSLWEEKPLTGWGTEGVIAAKQLHVDHGQAHPSVMQYEHAHNEILDMLAKRGVLGLVVLLLLYVIPLTAFWPTRSRIAQLEPAVRSQALGLRAAATLLPIAYFGFGWTQVFFAHNSGHMFYVFALVAFWGALRPLEKDQKHI